MKIYISESHHMCTSVDETGQCTAPSENSHSAFDVTFPPLLICSRTTVVMSLFSTQSKNSECQTL